MELKIQTGNNCLLYACAMVFDVDPDAMITSVGHTGDEVWWPEHDDMYRCRGHHIQEMVDYGLTVGCALIPIECSPRLGPSVDKGRAIFPHGLDVERLEKHLADYDAVVITETHAYAWDSYRRIFLDPRGSTIPRSNWCEEIREVWLCIDF